MGIPTRTILELQNGNGTEPWPSRNCAGSPVERAIRVFLLIKRILVSPRSLQALKISAGIFANMPVTQNKDCQLTAGSSPRAFKYHQWMGSRGFWPKGDPGSPLPGGWNTQLAQCTQWYTGRSPRCPDDGRVRSPLSAPILLARDRAFAGWAGPLRGAGSAGVVSGGRGLCSSSPPRAPPACPGSARWWLLRRRHGDPGERRSVLEAGREGGSRIRRRGRYAPLLKERPGRRR